MKWFHHECEAKHDLKLQVLGEEFGPEGIGIYWMLLEEIGSDSDTFHLKVTGVSATQDQACADATQRGGESADLVRALADGRLPRIPLKMLARILFTTEEKLLGVIEKSVEEDLFDESKWRTCGILYSAAFERRADNYTRRRRRIAESLRTMSEQTPTHVEPNAASPPTRAELDAASPPTHAELDAASLPSRAELDAASLPSRAEPTQKDVRPEQEQIQKQIQKQNEKEIQKQNENKKKKNLCNVPNHFELSTDHPQSTRKVLDGEAVLVPSAGYFTEVCTEFREAIREWNHRERSSIDWVPNQDELKKLFYGGDTRHRLWLSREAANLTGGRPDFPGVVLRALGLMLQASKTTRIQNPFGWMWSCLHGTPEGMPPWVHLPTALEEAGPLSNPRSPP